MTGKLAIKRSLVTKVVLFQDPVAWTVLKSQRFWRYRKWKILCHDDDRETKIRTFKNDLERHRQRLEEELDDFCEKFEHKTAHENAEQWFYETEAQNLEFWMVHGSWTYCDRCKKLMELKLFPRFAKRPLVKSVKSCNCTDHRYLVPKYENVHDSLKNLSQKEIIVLQPLEIHTGEYKRMRNGYRQKTDKFRVTWTKISVQNKINRLEDDASKQRCQEAYDYLMSERKSSYSRFVNKRETEVAAGREFFFYDFEQRKAIECALWPHLYPFEDWCETTLDGRDSRLSSKVSFMHKVMSEIADYSMDYELLQFHYDLWLWQTVTGYCSRSQNEMFSK